MSIIKLLTIRKQNYEKDFYLEGYVYPGSSYDIPLKLVNLVITYQLISKNLNITLMMNF